MQKVNLNLIPGGVRPVINVSQYDEGRQFQLAIFNGSASYDLTGKTVVIEVGKLDGNGVAYDHTDEVNNIPVVAVSGNVVTITTPKQMTAVAGQNNAELKISDSSETIGTLNFILDCEQSALSPETPLSDTQIPALEDLASQNAQKALDAVSHYPYIDDTTKNWFVWDVETGAFVDTGVRAQGIDGQGGVASVNNVLPDIDGNVALSLTTNASGILPTANGGTGNADGYIQTGQMSGYTAGSKATTEGYNNKAAGYCSHAEGNMCEVTSNSDSGHAEGYGCTVGTSYSHAGGYNSYAAAATAFAHGYYARATQNYMAAFGKYNKSYSDMVFAYGDGTADNDRHNLMTLYNDGRIVLNEADAVVTGGNLAPVVELTRTMSAQRTAGSYVFVVADKKTYYIDSTIAASGTLTPGTNATEVTTFGEIATLTSELTPKTVSTLSPTSNISSSSTLRCYTLGKLCTIQMSMNVNSSLAANAKLFTGAPVPYANNTAYATLNGIGKSLPIAMNANGECYVDGTAGSNSGWMDGCFVYIMA